MELGTAFLGACLALATVLPAHPWPMAGKVPAWVLRDPHSHLKVPWTPSQARCCSKDQG